MSILLPEELEYAKEPEIFELIVAKLLEKIEMLTRRGFSKAYVEEENNLYFQKGRILIEQNLRQNTCLKNRIFCRYSEFTCDTIENRILKYTLYHLSRVKLSSDILQKRVRQTIHFFDQVSFVIFYAKSFPKITYTRLNDHYRPIINLCQLIIENSTLDLQKTGEIRYSSFLIDMNRLFESFLLGFLSKTLKAYNVRGEGRGMHEYSLDLIGEMTQKPDIIIRKDGIDLLVIDAKYKQLQTNENKQIEVIISDARQVWSYCLVPKTKMPFGILVYPKHQLIEKAKENYSMKYGVSIILKTLDLTKATAEEFERECNNFAEEIINLLDNKVIPSIADVPDYIYR